MEVIGHQKAQMAIRQSLAGGNFAHAWLLHGPQGIGKARLALWAAIYILGGQEALDDGEHPIARTVVARSHPDFYLINMDEEESKTKIITVDKIRELNEKMMLTAGRGGWRVAIIDSACALNHQAANALLKILEEPPPRVAFLLPCHRLGRLPPTLVSRCRRLALTPPNQAEFSEILARALPRAPVPSEIERLRILGDNAPGVALQMKEWGCSELHQALARVLNSTSRLAQHEFVGLLERDKELNSWQAYATLMRGILERALASQVGAKTSTEIATEAEAEAEAATEVLRGVEPRLEEEQGLFDRVAPATLLQAIADLADLDERVERTHLSHPQAVLVSLEGVAALR